MALNIVGYTSSTRRPPGQSYERQGIGVGLDFLDAKRIAFTERRVR